MENKEGKEVCIKERVKLALSSDSYRKTDDIIDLIQEEWNNLNNEQIDSLLNYVMKSEDLCPIHDLIKEERLTSAQRNELVNAMCLLTDDSTHLHYELLMDYREKLTLNQKKKLINVIKEYTAVKVDNTISENTRISNLEVNDVVNIGSLVGNDTLGRGTIISVHDDIAYIQLVWCDFEWDLNKAFAYNKNFIKKVINKK